MRLTPKTKMNRPRPTRSRPAHDEGKHAVKYQWSPLKNCPRTGGRTRGFGAATVGLATGCKGTVGTGAAIVGLATGCNGAVGTGSATTGFGASSLGPALVGVPLHEAAGFLQSHVGFHVSGHGTSRKRVYAGGIFGIGVN